MSTELLTEQTVVAYLVEKKIISAADIAEVEVLTGGVSNVVLAITTKDKKLVLKQALAELKVAEKSPCTIVVLSPSNSLINLLITGLSKSFFAATNL